MLDINGVAFIK